VNATNHTYQVANTQPATHDSPRINHHPQMGSMLNEQSINYVYSQGEGAPPEEYNKVLDRSVVQTVVERLELLLQVFITDKSAPVGLRA
jgi:hypothetical protein